MMAVPVPDCLPVERSQGVVPRLPSPPKPGRTHLLPRPGRLHGRQQLGQQPPLARHKQRLQDLQAADVVCGGVGGTAVRVPCVTIAARWHQTKRHHDGSRSLLTCQRGWLSGAQGRCTKQATLPKVLGPPGYSLHACATLQGSPSLPRRLQPAARLHTWRHGGRPLLRSSQARAHGGRVRRRRQLLGNLLEEHSVVPLRSDAWGWGGGGPTGNSMGGSAQHGRGATPSRVAAGGQVETMQGQAGSSAALAAAPARLTRCSRTSPWTPPNWPSTHEEAVAGEGMPSPAPAVTTTPGARARAPPACAKPRMAPNLLHDR